jgi:succinate dehydrogenase/fumarate reductase flavoprotein subunit
LSNL